MSRDLCLDLFQEGFLVDVVTIVIAFIKDEIFDLHHFNDIIFHFEYSGNDENNKQQVAKKKNNEQRLNKQLKKRGRSLDCDT